MRGAPLAPVVSVTLFAQNGNTLPAIRAMVDSGADMTMFPLALMTALGISSSDCQTVTGRGAGGANDFLFWPGGMIKARLGRWDVELTPWFGSPAVTLLGRSDFFATFKSITFDEPGRCFTIQPK